MFRWRGGHLGIIRCEGFADTVLGTLSPEFDVLYAASGRPSIAPEYISRALFLQMFYSVRSEPLLVE
jgi:transposase